VETRDHRRVGAASISRVSGPADIRLTAKMVSCAFAPGEFPLERTLKAMDEAGVRVGILSARWGPHGPLISNDTVSECVGHAPNRFAGVASVDLFHPVQAVRDFAVAFAILDSKHCALCPSCGTCHPMTDATTRYTPSVSNSAYSG
jgi:hypothetical protein